jgi:hypothetical protein
LAGLSLPGLLRCRAQSAAARAASQKAVILLWPSGGPSPADLGATVFRHLGIDRSAHWTDAQGRPQAIVTECGRPIPELS